MGRPSLYQLAKNVPLVRGFRHPESAYHTGSVIENEFGLQVGRVIGKHLAWCLRKSPISAASNEYLKIMNRDGVLVIPDFLSDNAASLVREEFDRARSRLEFNHVRDTVGMLKVASLAIGEEDERFTHTREHLQRNPLILEIAAAVIRRPITSKPPLSIDVYRKENDSAPDNDVENILHADLHTPTVKSFYYLNDVDQANGAFVYAKGSHRFSWARLRHEYDMSVRTSKVRRNDKGIPESLLATRGASKRNIISGESMRRMHVVETQICGKANTLVIANNMGFHRRGEFTSERLRETILLNFRYLERPF